MKKESGAPINLLGSYNSVLKISPRTNIKRCASFIHLSFRRSKSLVVQTKHIRCVSDSTKTYYQKRTRLPCTTFDYFEPDDDPRPNGDCRCRGMCA